MKYLAGLITTLFFSLTGAFAQAPTADHVPAAKLHAAVDPINNFDKQSVMIKMRDGVKLRTDIYVPKKIKGRLPILFWRSPYGVSRVGQRSPSGSIFAHGLKELAEDGYIFVFQDIRGRHDSEGTFVMMRPQRNPKDAGAIDESTDAYDSIEWLVKHVRQNNGRVGMMGVSYPAWLAVMAAMDPPPALKAVSPQASPGDIYLTDDFFHNGAFRLSYGFEYVAFVEQGGFDFGTWDTYDWYLKAGALSNIYDQYIKGKDSTWNDFVAHPTYDAFWRKRSIVRQLGESKVPSMNVGGWFDVEDGAGPMDIYNVWRKGQATKIHYLVMGPWTHGGWLDDDRPKIGDISLKVGTSSIFREKMLVPFFAKYLKGREGIHLPQVRLFQTGSNQWQSFKEWPIAKPKTLSLYFRANGKLSFKPPQNSREAADHYISDPATPVPYRPRPIENTFAGPGWSEWQTIDQRFADSRPDVLTWVSDPLAEGLVVSGRIRAHLFAATTGTDSDWVVKLIDVLPENANGDLAAGGREILVSAEIMRARYRQGFEKAVPVKPGKIEEYQFALPKRDHKFLKGHRIMVQVQSTWFPLFDRNPQTFVPNIFQAKDGDFKRAEQSIYRDTLHPSHITLDIGK